MATILAGGENAPRRHGTGVLCEEIFPHSAAEPATEPVLVGNDPGEAVRRLASRGTQ